MTVVLADNHDAFREGLRALLQASGVDVVAEARDGDEAVRAVVLHRPDVVLMDLRMPRVDGLAATRRIVATVPPTRVLVLTTFDEDELVRGAIDAGAAGYLLKAMPPEDLVAVMDLAMRGYATFAPGVTTRSSAPPDPRVLFALGKIATLSDRERDILALLGEGRTNGEIAASLFLAVGTVKNLVSSVLAALGVRHRTEAAILARLARADEAPASRSIP